MPDEQIPVLTTDVQVMKVETEEQDFAAIMMSTVLSSHLYHLTRPQLMTLGAESIKMARGMKRLAKPKKLTVVERKLEVPS